MALQLSTEEPQEKKADVANRLLCTSIEKRILENQSRSKHSISLNCRHLCGYSSSTNEFFKPFLTRTGGPVELFR